MRSPSPRTLKVTTERPFRRLLLCYVITSLFWLIFGGSNVEARFVLSSTGILQGRVTDMNGAVIRGVEISSRNASNGLSYFARSDSAGFYQFVAMPVGMYELRSSVAGFKTQVVTSVGVEVGRTTVIDLQLAAGDISETVTIQGNSAPVDLEAVSMGQVINERTIRDAPLNGRYFVDLGLLVPGSVTPPQNANLAAPTRGLGSLGLVTAGNREDAVNFQINGITLNDQLNNVLNFNPPLGSIREFRIDNSTFSAEYGRSSGAIVDVATRSGTKDFHGEVYYFLRDDSLDARNFFTFTSSEPPPFQRHQFGFSVGGPLAVPRFGDDGPAFWGGVDRTFFFFNFEGLRQSQEFTLNSLVLSDVQRASVADPLIGQLIQYIPISNFTDSSGSARFIGSTPLRSDTDYFSIDVSHKISESDTLHAFFAFHNSERTEPTTGGTTLPGFGDIRLGKRPLLTINETHVISQSLVNTAKFGFNQTNQSIDPVIKRSPTTLGMDIGQDRAIGLPLISIPGGFIFGGPARQPLFRKDTTIVFADTMYFQAGRHSMKFGGEYRIFWNYNRFEDTGSFGFPTVPAFLAGNANSFTIVLGGYENNIRQPAIGAFIQDTFRIHPRLTLDLGFRYDLFSPPTDPEDRFVVFDPKTASLLRVGRDIDKPYRTNFMNLQPRLGFAWDPFGKGKTSLRAAYAIMVEQTPTNVVANLSGNPPLARTLSFAGPIRLENAITIARDAGLAPVTIDYRFLNSNIQSWNLNVQHELVKDLALKVGYIGSKGTHLRQTRNINQPVNGVRPFARLSPSSPELPGTLVGNIIHVESAGNSSYNALWTSLTKRFSHGIQFDASYTWSKSIDYSSTGTPPNNVLFQDSYNVRADRGLSDYDARHRFVMNALFEVPLKGNNWKEGWQFGAIAQFQTGNPVNLVISNTAINGIANTVRPDAVAPVRMVETVEKWFDPESFLAVPRFGNLGRNVIIGPGFSNLDLSLLKNTSLGDRLKLQARFEIFDVFNKANFGQPGRVVGSSTFARITNTRFSTGDPGSSRQLQLAVRVTY